MCYGDSNTWGYNPQNKQRFDEATRWTKLVQQLLGSEYEIIEEGLNGRTFANDEPGRASRNGFKHLQMLLETNRPLDLVIIMLGTNDLKTVYNANPKSIGRGLRETIRLIQNPFTYEGMAMPKILVVSPILIGDNYQSASDTFESFNQNSYENAKRLASFYQEQAEKHGCYFADAAKWAQASLVDAIHMDEANHRLFAEAISKVIKAIDNQDIEH